jgi:hypothetical protein
MTVQNPPVRKRAKSNLIIAKNAFAPDELFKLYRHGAMMLRAHAELDGVKGLQFQATKRGILPIEEVAGAGRLAETNDGPLGYASKSPAVFKALEERTKLTPRASRLISARSERTGPPSIKSMRWRGMWIVT